MLRFPNSLDGIGCRRGIVLDRSKGDGALGTELAGRRDVSIGGLLVEGTPPSRSRIRMGGSEEGPVDFIGAVDVTLVDGIVAGAAFAVVAAELLAPLAEAFAEILAVGDDGCCVAAAE
jgi:hypothetical protein